MIFRLTQKLNKKIKAGKLTNMPLHENEYADWSAHLFTASRKQYILLSNTMSLYSCVMPGKGITNNTQFIDRALETIRDFTADDAQQLAYRKHIVPASGSVEFAKALNRTVTGSMNELIKFAEEILIEDKLPSHEVGFQLNDIWLSALASEKSKGFSKPNDAFKLLSNGSGLCD